MDEVRADLGAGSCGAVRTPAPALAIRLELDEVRERFPDCLAWRIEEAGTRSLVRIEFELYASHFLLHGHDPEGCDLIVCWEDDLQDFHVPRIALRRLAETAVPPVIALPIRLKYEATIWTETTFLAECPPVQGPLQEDLLAWAASQGEVVFGKGAKNELGTLRLASQDGQLLSQSQVLQRQLAARLEARPRR